MAEEDHDFAYIPPDLDEGNEETGFFKMTAPQAILVRGILIELIQRRCESLSLYDEMPAAKEFHQSEKFIGILRGGNRSGKTNSAAVQIARAVTGQDPYGKWPKKNGIAFIFGLDGKHLSLTLFPKLFQPGAFQIIRDQKTKEWRTYRPWLDSGRANEAMPAPPLIPPRFIKDIVWEEKKSKKPQMVRLSTGWEMHFFSSLANAPHGQNIDMWWIDEEVEAEDLVDELAMRCLGVRKGRGFWSCAPQLGSRQLLDLHEKYEDGNPDIGEWELLVADNPYIDDDIKRKAFSVLSEEARAVRWYGENANAAALVYPEFSERVHAFQPKQWNLPESGFTVPYDWCVYASIDPGHQICAVTFWAVPPPKVGTFKLMYDELYLPQCNAHMFGLEFGKKAHDRVFQDIIIDHQQGRVRDMNFGLQIQEQYRQALIKNKVETRVPGCYFVHGSNDPKAGIASFRELLRVKPDGEPSFYVYAPNCPNLIKEMRRYRKKRIGKGIHAIITDDPESRGAHHLCDGCRYLAHYNPRYVAPTRTKAQTSWAVRAMEAKRKKRKDKQGEDGGIVRLG